MFKTTNRHSQFRQRVKPDDNTGFLFFSADVMRQQPSVFFTSSWQLGRLSKLCTLIDEHCNRPGSHIAEVEPILERELRWIEGILDSDLELKKALLTQYETQRVSQSD